jgi:hypothetical protein
VSYSRRRVGQRRTCGLGSLSLRFVNLTLQPLDLRQLLIDYLLRRLDRLPVLLDGLSSPLDPLLVLLELSLCAEASSLLREGAKVEEQSKKGSPGPR